MTNSEQEWDKHAIKAAVHRNGMTLTGIAIDAGLYKNACRQGLMQQSRRGAQAIADALGLPFETLFPNYPSGHNSRNNLSLNKKAGKRQNTTNVVDGSEAV